ncbi:MAG: ABC transporter permease [Thermotogaceae bacterium]|jgi:peptide/nickel transport system permease protein|nr:ABC transporter permease [Mesotoga sp.]NLX33789.1 ABC transporter permease [Thermotogaceae bacterium]MDD4041363.1 ABC transporter permease [Mesotoga sp.]MDD4478541.1 ABC transporter permease [Mesotoga sp.]HOY25637.1 ABC transporter permease [Mesotoga sp.]
MTAYILRRLISVPLTVIGVTLIVFCVIWSLGPNVLLNAYMTGSTGRAPNAAERIIEKYGLDEPAITRYFIWISNTLRGDLGYSMAGRMDVSEAILQMLPSSLELIFLSLIPIVLIGSRLGLRAAMNPNGPVDSVFGFLSTVGWATPDFILGLLILTGGFVFFKWLPIGGLKLVAIKDWEDYTYSTLIDSILNGRIGIFFDQLVFLLEPVLTLFLVNSAYIYQISRAGALEVKHADYIRTARSKGLSEREIMLKHVRKNAMIPVLTVGGELFASMVTGVVFVETIFARTGIGSLIADAALMFDVLTLSGCILVISIFMITVNLLVDIAYSLVNPKVTLWKELPG